MSRDERARIDSVFPAAPDSTADTRDGSAGALLYRLLQDDIRQFIYVNKVGAHFPWDGKYPSAESNYTPVLGMVGNRFLTHAAGQSGYRMSASQVGTAPYLNSWRNAAQWNIRSFFKALSVDSNWLRKSVLLYTSDHGQNLTLDGGRINTHCSTDHLASRLEGLVPLIGFTANPKWRGIFTEAAQRNHDRLGHFNIFPTLLAIMGHGADALPPSFEPPMWGRLEGRSNRRFTTGTVVRFGRKPAWVAVP
jgi:hypothetical protein